MFPRQATDIIAAADYLSGDPASRDYLRLRDGSAAATGGTAGDWPSYIGALPPGPAPKEGDWFTRLQERWEAVERALPTGEPAE